MNKIFGKIKDESGQALVVVAVSLVAIFGITAFTVDMGRAYNAKAELQAAADAAALAGAQSLPDVSLAKSKAQEYAVLNDAVVGEILSIESPVVTQEGVSYSNQVKVTLKREFDYLIAGVLGFDSTIITVSATAEEYLIWGGETLPFINIDEKVTEAGQTFTLWENTGTVSKPGTGDFELLLNNPNNPGYEFTYADSDGNGNNKGSATKCMLTGLDDGFVDVKNGVKAALDSEVEELCELWSPPNTQFVYILSLSNETITTPPENYINGNGMKENGKVVSASIPLNQIVLLKCEIVDVNLTNTGDRGITLKYLGGDPIYLSEAIPGEDFIPGFINHDARARLVD